MIQNANDLLLGVKDDHFRFLKYKNLGWCKVIRPKNFVFMYDHEFIEKGLGAYQFGALLFFANCNASFTNECQKCKITLEGPDAQGL